MGHTVPEVLFQILSRPDYASVISWLPRGDGFVVLDPERFRRKVLPRHFRRVTNFRSFRRKLNRYGFRTMRRATLAAALADPTVRNGVAAFEHDRFRRGRLDLLAGITCQSGGPTPAEDAERGVAAAARKVCAPGAVNADAFVAPAVPGATASRTVVEHAVISPNIGNANTAFDRVVPGLLAPYSKIVPPLGGRPQVAIANAAAGVAPGQGQVSAETAQVLAEIERRIQTLKARQRINEALLRMHPALYGGLLPARGR